MYIYELKYSNKNIKMLQKDSKFKLLFAILLFISTILTWVFSLLILQKREIMTTEEWFVAIGITCLAVMLILFLALAILKNNKTITAIKSNNYVNLTELRFFQINNKSDFSVLYFGLVVGMVALLTLITIISFVIKTIDGQLLSLFLMLFLFLTICGYNSLFHIKIKQNIDKETEVELIKNTKKQK